MIKPHYILMDTDAGSGRVGEEAVSSDLATADLSSTSPSSNLKEGDMMVARVPSTAFELEEQESIAKGHDTLSEKGTQLGSAYAGVKVVKENNEASLSLARRLEHYEFTESERA